MTLQELKSEITNDPAGVGYSTPYGRGDDTAVAALLNAKTGPGAATILETVTSKGDFVLAIINALARIDALEDAAKKQRWVRYWEAIQASESFRVGDPRVAGLLDLGVVDGVLTSQERAIVGKRIGSRAEVLWGDGASVSVDQVSATRSI